MRKRRERQAGNTWLSSRWFFITIIILFVLLSASLIKELYRSYQIKKEIDTLKSQIESLENENQEFAHFVEYLKTDRYFEEQARIKLGLKAPGEKVIVLKGEEETENPPEQAGGLVRNARDIETAGLTNPQKWLSYFLR